MPLKTPPLHAKGVYALKVPFADLMAAGVIYECIAIRSFNDFLDAGQKVFETVYAPRGLTTTEYNADKAAKANIITLASPSHPTIHVPDTYIDSYPNLGNVAYKIPVLAIELGPIPDTTDLSFLAAQVSSLVSDTIGAENTVNVVSAPSTGVVTADEHAALETARQAAITNRTTDRAKVIDLTAQLAAAQDKISGLEQIIIDAGLLPP